MRNFSFIVLAFMLMSFSDEDANKILVTIADKEITLGEFSRIYEKNKKLDILGEPKSCEDYLDLFVNYKLKVAEAEDEGLDTLQKFKTEFAGYVGQLAEPYLLDQSVDSAIVKEAYERMKYDVKASHILIKVSPVASPADTAKAYEKLLRIRQRLINGEDFEKVAKATSDDPSAKNNGGDLGYATAFTFVYPFENVMYSTEVGEISNIFKTKYGYHVLKVTDKQPSRGQVNISHIMVLAPKSQQSSAEWNTAKETIDSIYIKLKNGENFEELAKKYSTDTKSSNNGGNLGWLSNSMPLPQEFKDAMFALETPGNFSEPIKTPYGYHILKLNEKKAMQPFAEIEKDLRKKVAKDEVRSNKSKEALVEKLKEEYPVTILEGNLSNLMNALPERGNHRYWVKPDTFALENEVLLTFADQEATTGEFTNWMRSNRKKYLPNIDKKFHIQGALDAFIADKLIEFEKGKLPEENTEYKDLLTEYHDGMLLFEISNKKVWKKANNDTIGLEAYHKRNETDFMWGERLSVNLYFCKDAETKANVEKLFAKAKKKGLSTDAILKKANAKDPDALKIESKLYSHGENKIVDSLQWTPGTSADFGKTMFLEIVEVRQPEPKKLSECRGAAVAAYQKALEQLWIEELHNKYEVSINKELLKEIDD